MAWACALGWHNWTVVSVRNVGIIGFIEQCDWCSKRRLL